MPSLDELRVRLEYDPLTGFLTRKTNTRIHKAGTLVKTLDKRGYVVYQIGRRVLPAHRIAWLLYFGEIDDTLVIDHINGNRSDNRIENLRLVTQGDNIYNAGMRGHNRSGYTGIGYVKPSGGWKGGWRARISGEHIGFYDTFEEAVTARSEELTRRGILTIDTNSK